MLSKTASQKPWRINSELKRTVNIIPLLTQLTIQNIFPYHTDVVVTVRSTLLVPETQLCDPTRVPSRAENHSCRR